MNTFRNKKGNQQVLQKDRFSKTRWKTIRLRVVFHLVFEVVYKIYKS